MQSVSIYRAATGVYRPQNNAYEGVTDGELERQGIFCQNYSAAQTRSGLSGLFIDQDNPYNLQFRKVEGLPVFLNQSEAEVFIHDARFINNGAIVRADIPVELLFGAGARIKLTQNSLDQRLWKDKDLKEEDLDHRVSGEKPIKGEIYMQGIFGGNVSREVIDELKQYTTVLRPIKTEEGKVDLEKGYTEIKLNRIPTDATQEISLK